MKHKSKKKTKIKTKLKVIYFLFFPSWTRDIIAAKHFLL